MKPLEVVQELNQMLYDKHQEELESFFYLSNGHYEAILFGDISIWDSENDERKFLEKENDYEPLLPFVKKIYNKKLTHLKSLSL